MSGIGTQAGFLQTPAAGGGDPDANAYFDAISAAGSSISAANQTAVTTLIQGLKADGNWSAIKACCLLAGPDDLTGALVPLIGPAPTNSNFVSGDYSRTLGLQGDGSTKSLDSNRNNNADPQNSKHIAAYVTDDGNDKSSNMMGVDTVASGGTWMGRTSDGTSSAMRSNSSASYVYANAWPIGTGLIGASRSGAALTNFFAGDGLKSDTIASDVPTNETISVFAGVAGGFLDVRLAFYSIGENINLTQLNSRLSTYVSSLT